MLAVYTGIGLDGEDYFTSGPNRSDFPFPRLILSCYRANRRSFHLNITAGVRRKCDGICFNLFDFRQEVFCISG